MDKQTREWYFEFRKYWRADQALRIARRMKTATVAEAKVVCGDVYDYMLRNARP